MDISPYIFSMHSSRMKILFLCISALVVSAPVFSQTFQGQITGRIIDAKTKEPIPGVNILVVEKEGAGAATSVEGTFRIDNLKVGTYSLRVSAVGYETQVLTNVVVSTGRQSPVFVALDETILTTGEVTVKASYQSRGDLIAPLSTNALNRSEILRSPGGVQDVQRVVQSLPGVASSTDNINELIVRGGAPFENLTVMEHMEIPSINHYSNQYNSAGPINMVNADMIRDVQFSAGGFPAMYGDKTSSVMNISIREGNRDVGFASNTGFNMAGIGTLCEGGFAGGRGSYIVSARQSLLQLVDKIVGISSISLTAIPKYWDTQAKLVYDLTPTQKLSFNVLYGRSKIDLAGDPKEKDVLRANRIDSSSVQNIFPLNTQYIVGLNYQTLWGKDGYGVLTLYGAGSTMDVNVYSDFAVRQRGPQGEVLSYQILNSNKVFSNKAHESFVAAKYEAYYQIDERNALSAGAQLQTANKWQNEVWARPDTTRFDLNQDGTYETGPVIIPEASVSQTLTFGAASKYFAYLSDKFSITPRLALTAGVRYDHFTFSGQGNVSPRFSLSYQLIPSTTTLSIAAGVYYQTHPFPYYGDRRSLWYNRNLENMRANHYVFSLEHFMDEGLKLSLEAYYKDYSHVVVSEGFVYSADPTYWSDRNLAIGKRRSYGLEFFVEQKQVHDFFGTLSVSLSDTKDSDPRIPPKTDWYPSEFDYPVIVSALAGHVARGVRDWLDDAPFFIKYPSYILPISNEMEISFKYRYQAGRPYTPKTYVTWKQSREGGITWSQGAWIDSDRINSARYPDYGRFDIQWISRFYLNKWNINFYFTIINLFNKKNVFYQSYRSDGTVQTVYQFTLFPVGGVEVEF